MLSEIVLSPRHSQTNFKFPSSPHNVARERMKKGNSTDRKTRVSPKQLHIHALSALFPPILQPTHQNLLFHSMHCHVPNRMVLILLRFSLEIGVQFRNFYQRARKQASKRRHSRKLCCSLACCAADVYASHITVISCTERKHPTSVE